MISRAAAVPERRNLTVLFCDVVGSTAMAQRLDPEDLRELMLRYQQLVRDLVTRYGGFVARYMGDGVLVYFGYPAAHEDDAARAIHAGLDIVAAAQRLDPPLDPSGKPVPLRIGIATGLVVVGDRIGAGAAEEAAAVGEAPNLASRLQSCAEPQTVLVADRTQQLAGSRFVYAPARELTLSGYLQPVRAWTVLRANPERSRFDQTHPAALTPWVGRSDELSRLFDLWREAARGAGQIVLVAGDAGVGKSRLVQTLSERIKGVPFYRICYQCSPYHVDSAFHPFIDQLEKAAGFTPGEATSSRLDKMRRLLGGASPALAGAMPLFAELLSLPVEGAPQSWPPERRRNETMAAILGRLRELALQRPVLLVLEDAHWIDPSTLDLLGLLAAQLPSLPVLLVVTSRVADTRQAWLQGPRASVLSLERLAPQEAAELANHVAMPTPAAAEQLAQVVERADGVPLFIEELAKAIGAGLSASEIPETLHDLLMARLDQLGNAKEVAQVAAVIGREFSRESLAALLPLPAEELDAALATMVAASVVQQRPQRPVFVFHHALIQDAAYGSLLRTRRLELHGAFAEALERLDSLRAHAEPELLAQHYALAGRPLQAARWWAQAAQRALGRSANVEALRHSERGSELLATAPATVERERLELMLAMLGGAAHRAVHGFASIDAERCFARALELSEQLGDIATQVDVRRGLFSWHYARGELGLARAQGQRVADIGEGTGDRSACMLGHWMLGAMSMWQGEFADARHELELAISLYHPEEHRLKTLAVQIDPRVNAMAHLSWVCWIGGDSDGAVEAGVRAVDAARSVAQPYALTMALFFACAVRACRGEHDRAEPLLQELLALAGEHGLSFLRACAGVLRGDASIAAHRYEDGLVEIERALSEFDALHAGLGRPWALAIAAAGCMRLGRRDDGLQKIAAAFAAIERHGERHWEAEVWRVKGELLWPGAEARACLQRAAEVAARQSAGALRARALASLATLER